MMKTQRRLVMKTLRKSIKFDEQASYSDKNKFKQSVKFYQVPNALAKLKEVKRIIAENGWKDIKVGAYQRKYPGCGTHMHSIYMEFPHKLYY